MSPFVVIALCLQICLIQSAMSQQQCGFPQLSYGAPALNQINSLPSPSASCASYGGVGTGQVGVSGDIDASGNTVVVGSVPVLGSVDFSGCVPASGSVSISGQCGCGCNA